MELADRLELMRSGGVISPGVEALALRVISRFGERWRISLNEENGSRMMTHLAMALMRIERGEEIKGPETGALEEFRDLEVFPLSLEILDDLIAWVPMRLPEPEKEYMIINICLILDPKNDG
jgi:transcriptional regulatory protein LevR